MRIKRSHLMEIQELRDEGFFHFEIQIQNQYSNISQTTKQYFCTSHRSSDQVPVANQQQKPKQCKQRRGKQRQGILHQIRVVHAGALAQ